MSTISHPEWLKPYLAAHPTVAGPLITTLYDLSLSVGWQDLRIVSLEGWVVLIGHKRKEDPLRPVLPLPLHTTSLRPSSLKAIFRTLSTLNIEELPLVQPLAPTVDELRERLRLRPDQAQASNSASELEQITEVAEASASSEDGMGEAEPESKTSSTSTFDAETLYMAIVTDDSTVVYYKLSKGIKKPADVPDE